MAAVVEDWFAQALGTPFQELHLVRRWGFPIVHTQCDFLRPCRLGDMLALELVVARLGRSSIEFDIRGRVAGEEKLHGRHKVAMVSLDTMRSMPIPDHLRARMAPYVVERDVPSGSAGSGPAGS
jgi:4-hydroxybenzoyl-CoA thioesterase